MLPFIETVRGTDRVTMNLGGSFPPVPSAICPPEPGPVPCVDKAKALEDELAELKKKREVLTEVCASLQKDADQLAEKAENKSNTLMAQIITKFNTLRRRYKEKCNELKNVESELELKASELRHMH